jgi:hypothetical protein
MEAMAVRFKTNTTTSVRIDGVSFPSPTQTDYKIDPTKKKKESVFTVNAQVSNGLCLVQERGHQPGSSVRHWDKPDLVFEP